MTFDEILSGVKDEIAETLNLEKSAIANQQLLVADLGAESIDFIDLTFRLEKRFKIEIPEGELFESAEQPSTTLTVNSVAQYILDRLPAKP
ncbi:MAG: phosphopantetheine-binding protein [Verrucomicrobiales bacterium]|nr:phosphopantetheine-binding protein [Verrucomicrobiales bacterium]